MMIMVADDVVLGVADDVADVVAGVAEFSDNGLQSVDECTQPGPGRSGKREITADRFPALRTPLGFSRMS